ncbi:MAG: outer membrane protein assembly factor BamA [Gammaproteobacteria bacterium]|nr:MAG: outer membrane protein assembly factor BamA [Gammaproteobacteria bacterium]
MNKLFNKRKWLKIAAFWLLSLSCLTAYANGFYVKDIRVEGLRRISAGTVFTYLPVQVGDYLDKDLTAKAIKDLYATGFFSDIELKADEDILVIRVAERPSITEIIIKGNSILETDPLLEGLKGVGLSEGRVYNRRLLDSVKQELFRQYYDNGNYDVKVSTTVTPLVRNRVSILIEITEGEVARIKGINIVGNKLYSDEELLGEFDLGIPSSWAIMSDSDEYSKEKLQADLETLRSRYLNDGYINFKIDSTQVSLSPDKRYVFITINIVEGDKYMLGGFELHGDTSETLQQILQDSWPDTEVSFSNRLTIDVSTKLKNHLKDEGYAFANINAVPDVNEEAKSVKVKFYADKGKRVYVRRIIFEGNEKTRDEVLRREMRIFEGGWYSAKKIKRSRVRLQRLGFFEGVDIKTPAVADSPDQVDVVVRVAERDSGAVNLFAGYGEGQGISFGASLKQDNFLGSGDRFGFEINTSKTNTVYSVDFNDPYFTDDGVSRGFNLFFRQTDTNEIEVSSYATDTWGGMLSFGFPITEDEKVFIGLGYDWLKMKLVPESPQRVSDFVDKYGNEFSTIRAKAGWSSDTRNRKHFATDGSLQSLSLMAALPGSELKYYKMSYKHKWYYPLFEDSALMLRGDLGFGDGYDDTDKLPFFQNYYAGGVNTLRGYQVSTLGPTDPTDDDNPVGGNFKILGGTELIFPVPFVESDSVRLAAFFDAGNVFDTVDESTELSEFRYSTGLTLRWLSPVGGLVFSYAVPLNEKEDDRTKPFQFTMGTSF